VPGRKVYGEKLVVVGRSEYRLWNPKRSKLSAAIYNGLKFDISPSSKILYLGAASGTTASHISDIVSKGLIYCVEFSPRVFKELLEVCKLRDNMIPILSDARKPADYAPLLEEVDMVYQDVAQPNQAEILTENAMHFLKKGGYAMLAIKARSIDSSLAPRDVFDKEISKLNMFEIVKTINLEPYEKNHLFLLLKF
jgi:fibrillarin-like pre-rRNA processing protein